MIRLYKMRLSDKIMLYDKMRLSDKIMLYDKFK